MDSYIKPQLSVIIGDNDITEDIKQDWTLKQSISRAHSLTFNLDNKKLWHREIDIGDVVSCYVYHPHKTLEFGGYVTRKKLSSSGLQVSCMDYIFELFEAIITANYNAQTASAMLTSVIDTARTAGDINLLSGGIEATTNTYYQELKNHKIFSFLQTMTDLEDACFYVDPATKNLHWFPKSRAITNEINLNEGIDFTANAWSFDEDLYRMFNRSLVLGSTFDEHPKTRDAWTNGLNRIDLLGLGYPQSIAYNALYVDPDEFSYALRFKTGRGFSLADVPFGEIKLVATKTAGTNSELCMEIWSHDYGGGGVPGSKVGTAYATASTSGWDGAIIWRNFALQSASNTYLSSDTFYWIVIYAISRGSGTVNFWGHATPNPTVISAESSDSRSTWTLCDDPIALYFRAEHTAEAARWKSPLGDWRFGDCGSEFFYDIGIDGIMDRITTRYGSSLVRFMQVSTSDHYGYLSFPDPDDATTWLDLNLAAHTLSWYGSKAIVSITFYTNGSNYYTVDVTPSDTKGAQSIEIGDGYESSITGTPSWEHINYITFRINNSVNEFFIDDLRFTPRINQAFGTSSSTKALIPFSRYKTMSDNRWWSDPFCDALAIATKNKYEDFCGSLSIAMVPRYMPPGQKIQINIPSADIDGAYLVASKTITPSSMTLELINEALLYYSLQADALGVHSKDLHTINIGRG